MAPQIDPRPSQAASSSLPDRLVQPRPIEPTAQAAHAAAFTRLGLWSSGDTRTREDLLRELSEAHEALADARNAIRSRDQRIESLTLTVDALVRAEQPPHEPR